MNGKNIGGVSANAGNLLGENSMTLPEFRERFLAGKDPEEIRKTIAELKADNRRIKDRMECADGKLTPTVYPESLARLSFGRECIKLAKKALAEAGGEYVPDDADIRADDFLKALPFFSSLSFEIGGYFGGYKTYIVKANDGVRPNRRLRFSVSLHGRDCFPFPELMYETSDPREPFRIIKTVGQLTGYLKKLHMEEWMPVYSSDRFNFIVMDGTQWNLKIEFSGAHPSWTCFGDNSYPYNFDAFQSLFGLSFCEFEEDEDEDEDEGDE